MMSVVVTDELRHFGDLRPDPQNARQHPPEQIQDIAASIQKFGYVNKIAIRPNGMMIAGHGTADALRLTGVRNGDEIGVRVVSGLTELQYRELGAALNRLPEGSSWDAAMLRDLFEAVTADDGEDFGGMGFGDEEVDAILKPPADIAVKEVPTGKVDDEFWISIRGPLEHQARMLAILEAAADDLPGVLVELGTIANEATGLE